MKRRDLLSIIALSAALGGCSTFKKLTGKKDDTVLPGQREEILTPDQYRAKNEDLNPGGAGDAATTTPPSEPPAQPAPADECNPDVDPDCAPPPAKGTNKGIFNDG